MKSKKINKNQWKSIEIIENQWKSMKIIEKQWRQRSRSASEGRGDASWRSNTVRTTPVMPAVTGTFWEGGRRLQDSPGLSHSAERHHVTTCKKKYNISMKICIKKTKTVSLICWLRKKYEKAGNRHNFWFTRRFFELIPKKEALEVFPRVMIFKYELYFILATYMR